MDFSTLLGKVLVSIRGGVDDAELIFITSTGTQYKLYHEQDCCETVYIEDIVGELDDLIGSPILMAEEVTQAADAKHWADTATWTFYKLATLKGYVTIRWYGTSNGYYSETADFCKVA